MKSSFSQRASAGARRAAKLVAARMWLACGLDRVWPRGAIILTYHRVLPAALLGEAVDDPVVSPSITVSLEAFREHLDALSARFRVVSLPELVRRVADAAPRAAPSDERLAAVTFDDGWADNWRFALPELEKRGLPATLFLATDFIGSRRRLWWDEAARCLVRAASGPATDRRRTADLLAAAEAAGEAAGRPRDGSAEPDALAGQKRPPAPADAPGERIRARADRLAADLADFPGWPLAARRRFLERTVEALKNLPAPALEARLTALAEAAGLDREADPPEMLSWDQTADMARRGVTIGSHTAGHAILTRLPDEQVRRELADSAQALADHGLGTATLLCYPNGDADDRVAGLVRQAGYEAAVTTVPGHIPPGATPDLYRLPRLNVSLAQERPLARFLFHLSGVSAASRSGRTATPVPPSVDLPGKEAA